MKRYLTTTNFIKDKINNILELAGQKVLTGGHTTSSGHQIGMTDDQMTDFAEKYMAAVRDIMTDTAFTGPQKHELIKQMPNMKDYGFYHFLNITYQSGPSLAQYIRQYVSKDRPRNTKGLRGTK